MGETPSGFRFYKNSCTVMYCHCHYLPNIFSKYYDKVGTKFISGNLNRVRSSVK